MRPKKLAVTQFSLSLTLFVLILLAEVLGACGSDSSGEPEALKVTSAPLVTFNMKYPLAAGTEQYICQLVQIPESADGEVFMSGRAHDYHGGHHYGLYRTTLSKLPEGAELNKPEDCWGPHNFMQHATDFVILEQTAHSDVDFPAGVALPFKSGEIMVLEMHSLNATATQDDVTVDVKLKTMPKSDVKQKMGFLQFYDPYVYVPPMAKAEAGLRCRLPNDVTLIEANAHFHLRGVNHKTYIDPPTGPRSTTPLLESTDWEHPPQWHGSLAIQGGSHVRFRCQYENHDNKTYLQGPSKNDDEMCSFWGYVYPAPEDRTVLACLGENVDEFGDGKLTCAQTLDCIKECPPGEAPDLSVPGKFTVGPCYMKCMVDSCPSAGALVAAVGQCVTEKCASECPGDGCDACKQTKCSAEASACLAATCE